MREPDILQGGFYFDFHGTDLSRIVNSPSSQRNSRENKQAKTKKNKTKSNEIYSK